MMEGKPITITDLNMTRFMMTLDDAVDLVMYAFEHGNNGDLFVQRRRPQLSTYLQKPSSRFMPRWIPNTERPR